MSSPLPRQVYIVETQQQHTKSWRVEAESQKAAESRYADGTLIHSETGPEIVVSTETEL
jgi:hypothetical protein